MYDIDNTFCISNEKNILSLKHRKIAQYNIGTYYAYLEKYKFIYIYKTDLRYYFEFTNNPPTNAELITNDDIENIQKDKKYD